MDRVPSRFPAFFPYDPEQSDFPEVLYEVKAIVFRIRLDLSSFAAAYRFNLQRERNRRIIDHVDVINDKKHEDIGADAADCLKQLQRSFEAFRSGLRVPIYSLKGGNDTVSDIIQPEHDYSKCL